MFQFRKVDKQSVNASFSDISTGISNIKQKLFRPLSPIFFHLSPCQSPGQITKLLKVKQLVSIPLNKKHFSPKLESKYQVSPKLALNEKKLYLYKLDQSFSNKQVNHNAFKITFKTKLPTLFEKMKSSQIKKNQGKNKKKISKIVKHRSIGNLSLHISLDKADSKLFGSSGLNSQENSKYLSPHNYSGMEEFNLKILQRPQELILDKIIDKTNTQLASKPQFIFEDISNINSPSTLQQNILNITIKSNSSINTSPQQKTKSPKIQKENTDSDCDTQVKEKKEIKLRKLKISPEYKRINSQCKEATKD